MSNIAVTELAMMSSAAGQSPAGVQPTAQQSARFEQQLQAGGVGELQYYQAPLAEGAGMSGNWRVVMNDLGQMAEQYRTESMAFDHLSAGTETLSSSPEIGGPASGEMSFAETMSRLSHMSFTMMSITFVTSAERLAGENVRTLYQVG